MRFAILGTHPDGLEMASALVESGRHQIVAYTGSPVPEAHLRRWGSPRSVGDLEEVLADPVVEAVIVAGSVANRPVQLRRALQSERHVLCVHPPDQTPDIAYEAAMIQADTHMVLFPILPETLHPAVGRLAGLLLDPNGPAGTLRLLEMERHSPGEVLLLGSAGQKPAFPGWDVLRAVGGEIAEVGGFALEEEVPEDQPVLVAGRFETWGLFQSSFLPAAPQALWRLAAHGTRGDIELLFPSGPQGSAYLTWRDRDGTLREEAWTTWDPWPELVKRFESAVAKQSAAPRWQDVIRALELDDAARRGVERRRASTLAYPEATEEVGFKGTMTLVGCGLLWALLVLLVVANWYPALFWAVGPLLVLFLSLQAFRWAVPRRRMKDEG